MGAYLYTPPHPLGKASSIQLNLSLSAAAASTIKYPHRQRDQFLTPLHTRRVLHHLHPTHDNTPRGPPKRPRHTRKDQTSSPASRPHNHDHDPTSTQSRTPNPTKPQLQPMPMPPRLPKHTRTRDPAPRWPPSASSQPHYRGRAPPAAATRNPLPRAAPAR
jgi:hypothetical protein